MGIFDDKLQLDWGDPSASMRTLSGDPIFGMGLSLLAAGQDDRINPFNAALQGMQGANRQKTLLEAAARKKLEDENMAKLRGGVTGLIGEGTAMNPMPGGEMSGPGALMDPKQLEIAKMYQEMAQYGDPSTALAGYEDLTGAGNEGNTKKWQDYLDYAKRPPEEQKRILEFFRGQDIQTIGGNKVRVFGDMSEHEILSTLSNEMKAAVAMKGADKLGAVYGAKYDQLNSSKSARRENYAQANSILKSIKDQELKTGLYTGLVYKILPTPQQEQLDALAEFAARERLKASGEIRPTDADVTGMKRALFGSSLTEEFNKQSLERLVREIEGQEHEFNVISEYFGMIPQTGLPATGQLPAPTPPEAVPGLLTPAVESLPATTNPADMTPLQMLEELEKNF